MLHEKQKMPPLVRGKRSGNSSGNRIPFEHAADASITVFVFADGLKEIKRGKVHFPMHKSELGSLLSSGSTLRLVTVTLTPPHVVTDDIPFKTSSVSQPVLAMLTHDAIAWEQTSRSAPNQQG